MIQRSYNGDLDKRFRNVPQLVFAGQYVHIARSPLTTLWQSNCRLIEIVNKCSQNFGPFTNIGTLPSAVNIEENRILNTVLVDHSASWGTLITYQHVLEGSISVIIDGLSTSVMRESPHMTLGMCHNMI